MTESAGAARASGGRASTAAPAECAPEEGQGMAGPDRKCSKKSAQLSENPLDGQEARENAHREPIVPEGDRLIRRHDSLALVEDAIRHRSQLGERGVACLLY